MALAHETKLRILQSPWLDLLPSIASLPERKPLQGWRRVDPNEPFWLQSGDWDCPSEDWEYRREDRQARRSVRKGPDQLEALELLALLARVDWTLWKKTIHRNWPREARNWKDILASDIPREVGVELYFTRPGTRDELFKALKRAANPAEASTDFMQTKRILMASLKQRGVAVAPVRVRLTRRTPGDEHDTPELPAMIMDLLARYRDQRKPIADSRFQIDEVRLMGYWFEHSTQSLRDLLALGASESRTFSSSNRKSSTSVRSSSSKRRSLSTATKRLPITTTGPPRSCFGQCNRTIWYRDCTWRCVILRRFEA